MNGITADEGAKARFDKGVGELFGKTLGAALMLGSSTHALAQDAAPSSQQDNSPAPKKTTAQSPKEQATKLGSVNVYGQGAEPTSPKFTAPLIDTAMSVTVLPQSVMQETAATSLQDALRNVPGITFAAGEGGTPTGDLPSIRGFNSAGNIYVDDMRDIGVQTRDIFDLEQVEIVKGPDSSIAGRSAGGGTLNLVSKTAQPNNFVEVASTYGSAGQYRATFDGNLRVNDSIAARLNILDMGGGVPGRDSAVRTDKKGAAATVTFGLNKPTRFILNYYYFEDKSTPDYGVPVDYAVTGEPLTQTLGINPKNYYGLTDRDFRHNPVNAVEGRFEHDFGEAWTLRSQARYTDSENNYVLTLPYQATTGTYFQLLPPGEIYRLPISNYDRTRSAIAQTDLTGHFDTGFIHHDVDLGIEGSQEKERLGGGSSYTGYTVTSTQGQQGFSGGACPPALIASYDCTSLYAPNPSDPWQGTVVPNTNFAYYTTRDFAAYAFDTLTLTPHWKINGGVRWDDYLTSARDPSSPSTVDASDHLTFTSYQASLMYKPVEQGTIYLMTSSSSIPEDQAFSNAGQDQAFPSSSYSPSSSGLKPEITHSFELGTKWNLFNSHLLLSGDVFDEKHRNTAIEVAPDVWSQLGETESKGVELSANGSITENWNVIGGYSHVDARILKAGLNNPEEGDHVPNTPANTFSLWSTYRILPAVTIGAGSYYRGRQIGYAGPPDEYIDGYWRFDTMAKWQIDQHIALQFNVQNIFNKFYYSKIFYWYALPAPGRTYMATIDVRI
jgi:catecholate siderophore receptor